MPLFLIYLLLSYSMKTWADVYIVYIVWLVDVDWMHLEVGLKWVCWLCADLLWIFKVKVSREIAQCSPCRTRTYATRDSGSNAQSTDIYRAPQCMSPRWNWDSPTPLAASECALPPGPKGGGAHSPAAKGVGESQFQRLEKRLALCLLCAPSPLRADFFLRWQMSLPHPKDCSKQIMKILK